MIPPQPLQEITTLATGEFELGALALYEAGDNDPSTGGPDFVRNIFPMMVTLNEQGFQELSSDEVGERFRVINERRTESGGVAGGALR